MDAVIIWYGPFWLDKDLPEEEFMFDRGVYMLLHSKPFKSKRIRRIRHLSILYIGQTYDRSLYERINEHRNQWAAGFFDLPDRVTFKVGIVEPPTPRLTRKLLNDVEALLIITQQPDYNLKLKDIYMGRDLRIENDGMFKPLPEVISTDELEEIESE